MKRLLLLMGMLVVSVSLIGCGDTSVNASLPSGYEIITKDDVTINNQLYTLKHIKSGCFYSLSIKRDSSGGTSMIQMSVKENGASVPYCD